MRQKSVPSKEPSEKVVKEIRRATRKRHSREVKIRIVLSGLRSEDSIAKLCRYEGLAQSLYYRWSKGSLEADRKRLAGDTVREVKALTGRADRADDLARATLLRSMLTIGSFRPASKMVA